MSSNRGTTMHTAHLARKRCTCVGSNRFEEFFFFWVLARAEMVNGDISCFRFVGGKCWVKAMSNRGEILGGIILGSVSQKAPTHCSCPHSLVPRLYWIAVKARAGPFFTIFYGTSSSGIYARKACRYKGFRCTCILIKS